MQRTVADTLAAVPQSAALGLAIAGAIAFGYSNIFVTAPSPENLNTLFDFVFQGLDALEYKASARLSASLSNGPCLLIVFPVLLVIVPSIVSSLGWDPSLIYAATQGLLMRMKEYVVQAKY